MEEEICTKQAHIAFTGDEGNDKTRKRFKTAATGTPGQLFTSSSCPTKEPSFVQRRAATKTSPPSFQFFLVDGMKTEELFMLVDSEISRRRQKQMLNTTSFSNRGTDDHTRQRQGYEDLESYLNSSNTVKSSQHQQRDEKRCWKQPPEKRSLEESTDKTSTSSLVSKSKEISINSMFDQRWCKMFKLLEKFQQEHGHCKVPVRDGNESEKLYQWVFYQQDKYEKKKLSSARVEMLEKPSLKKGGRICSRLSKIIRRNMEGATLQMGMMMFP